MTIQVTLENGSESLYNSLEEFILSNPESFRNALINAEKAFELATEIKRLKGCRLVEHKQLDERIIKFKTLTLVGETARAKVTDAALKVNIARINELNVIIEEKCNELRKLLKV